jgi:hypothetical protein
MEEMMGGVSETKLDLHATIDRLFLFKSDLEAYFWDRTGDAALDERQRYQIALWVRQVSDRSAELSDVLLHMGCSTVIVAVTPAERESLRCALANLDRWIDEGTAFDDVLRSVATILHAADVICLRAAGGRRDATAGRDAAPSEPVAIACETRGAVVQLPRRAAR